jgi:hypothetical protein
MEVLGYPPGYPGQCEPYHCFQLDPCEWEGELIVRNLSCCTLAWINIDDQEGEIGPGETENIPVFQPVDCGDWEYGVEIRCASGSMGASFLYKLICRNCR